MSKADAYMVVFADDQGLTVPMTASSECDGALESVWNDEPVALFATRSEARRAIRVSRRFGLLRKEQGRTYNSDFVDTPECVKVVPCVRA